MATKRWKEPDNTLWRLYEYEYAFCSVCGNSVWMGFDTTEQAQNSWDEEHLYAYCPHCGTKMFIDNVDSEKDFKNKNHFLEASDRCCSNCCHHKTHYEYKNHDELMIQKCKLSGIISGHEIDVDFSLGCDRWEMKADGTYKTNRHIEIMDI